MKMINVRLNDMQKFAMKYAMRSCVEQKRVMKYVVVALGRKATVMKEALVAPEAQPHMSPEEKEEKQKSLNNAGSKERRRSQFGHVLSSSQKNISMLVNGQLSKHGYTHSERSDHHHALNAVESHSFFLLKRMFLSWLEIVC